MPASFEDTARVGMLGEVDPFRESLLGRPTAHLFFYGVLGIGDHHHPISRKHRSHVVS